MSLIIDSHLDLAWNAVSFNRDLTEDIQTICAREAGMDDERCRGNATVNLAEMRKGGLLLCVATLLVRAKRQLKTFRRTELDHRNQEIAHALARAQMAYYGILEKQGHVHLIRTVSELRSHWSDCQNATDRSGLPIGIILSMEGADPIIGPDEVGSWWDDGLRLVGVAHYGPCCYAQGTGDDGPLTPRGRDLVRELDRAGFVLDMTHTADQGWYEAMELFQGPVIASHNNCRALVPGDRQFSDEQINILIERGGVIGAVCDNWMLVPGYKQDQTPRESVTLSLMADHIDHVCQLAGNCRHSAIGSDLDGGFGSEQSPSDLETIADLQKLVAILESRGYPEADIDSILHGNWLRFFATHLPD